MAWLTLVLLAEDEFELKTKKNPRRQDYIK